MRAATGKLAERPHVPPYSFVSKLNACVAQAKLADETPVRISCRYNFSPGSVSVRCVCVCSCVRIRVHICVSACLRVCASV